MPYDKQIKTSEETKMVENMVEDSDVLSAYKKVPYSLINSELDSNSGYYLKELEDIYRFYKIYKKGMRFFTEGTNGDYVAADLKYKMASSLVNKEARFLFSETPDIVIEPKDDIGKITQEIKDSMTRLNSLLKGVLDSNMFEDKLLKAAKDCFIGKRVACLVNFNVEDGVTVSFIQSDKFIYETKASNSEILTKFVCFKIIKDAKRSEEREVFKKKYTLEDGVVYLEEAIYTGSGALKEVLIAKKSIELKQIPAVVFINDGLTDEELGESDIELLSDYEKWYSKLSNGDIDADRKSMNPTKYTNDMDSNSTQNLYTSPGSIWHFGTDQNLDNAHPMVGLLEPQMNYKDALKITLDRIKTTAYEQVDMPNITLETMAGSITSGKALKAIYWPLITRCKEKMKMWGPKLRDVVKLIIEGSIIYPDCVKDLLDVPLTPVAYEVKVIQNLPLPEDEQEEKTLDMAEVETNVMSKKAYMKKWRGLTDEEVDEELKQMAVERQLIEDSAFVNDGSSEDKPYPDIGA